ncbi:hypothetical protein RZA67_04395 [Stenotrophomonas sp. C3(2023)]|nr:hypothetical protein [Stenotrophomonas sp. C3(2023)]MDV3467974.1 hypothetical protein [Stenotrophomonas sp. C3(2023)]
MSRYWCIYDERDQQPCDESSTAMERAGVSGECGCDAGQPPPESPGDA